MKHSSKEELLACIEREHSALLALLRAVPRPRCKEPGVWGDEWTVHDLVTHLTEWQQMLRRWFEEGRDGLRPEVPAPGFKWNETPALNRAIQRRYADQPVGTALKKFAASCDTLHALARELTPFELLEPGHFAWTGKLPLMTYFAANTCSHYHFASKVLKRWMTIAKIKTSNRGGRREIARRSRRRAN